MGLFKSKGEKVLDLFESSYRKEFERFVQINADQNLGPREFDLFHGASLRNAAHYVGDRYRVGIDPSYFDTTYREIMLLRYPWGRRPASPTPPARERDKTASCDTYVKKDGGVCGNCGVHWYDHKK